MFKRILTAGVLLFFAMNSQAAVVFDMLDGKSLPLSDLKGKWVILNYWASWCHVCVDEIPTLNAFYEKSQGKNVALFAINYDALSKQEQKKLVQDLSIRYPSIASDPAYELGIGDIRGVPATFIINPEGRLVKTLYGAQTIKTLSRAISASDK